MDIREGIAEIVREINTKSVQFCPEVVDDEWYTNKILTYLKSQGYVKLDENQELPSCPTPVKDAAWCQKIMGEAMLKANFRRVIL